MTGPLWADSPGYGVKAGANLSNIVYGPDYNPKTDPIFGGIGGLFLDFQLGDVFYLQPEINFTMKGSEMKDASVLEGGLYPTKKDLTFRTDYLEVPVLLEMKFKGSGSSAFNLFLGPSAAWVLGSAVEVSGQSYPQHYSDPWDFGLILGAGLELDKFLLDLRYDFGMKLDAGENNSVLSLQIGYRVH